jgi:FkbM family methyltransferase
MLEVLAKKIYERIPNGIRIMIVPVLFKVGMSFGEVADEAILLGLKSLRILRKSGKLDLVLHVGGHKGQEAKIYERLGAKVIIWVEADPRHIEGLKKMSNKRTMSKHRVVNCIASSQDGDIKTLIRFNNDGASNSVFRPNENMKSNFPNLSETNENIEVRTLKLPSVLKELQIRLEDFEKSLLVLDVQGYELEVLNGCDEDFLKHFQIVVSEVSPTPLYHNSSSATEVIEKLEKHGFSAMSTIPRFHGDVVFKAVTNVK